MLVEMKNYTPVQPARAFENCTVKAAKEKANEYVAFCINNCATNAQEAKHPYAMKSELINYTLGDSILHAGINRRGANLATGQTKRDYKAGAAYFKEVATQLKAFMKEHNIKVKPKFFY